MLDPLKKIMMAALGAAFLTREKVEAIIQKMISSDQLSSEQGKKILSELVEKGKAGEEAVSARFHQELTGFFEKFQTVKRSEFDALCERVKALESQCPPQETGPTDDTADPQ